MPEEFCLLILNGHNSHCTYPFVKFLAHIIICLPLHTTHALQPCDVGVFGPLAHAWKSQVTQASQDNIPIIKDNLLCYYHNARSTALKPATIQSAFRKTGIYPFDHNAIPVSAFEPAKNTTMKATQPMPTQLPPSLILMPNFSPAPSAVTMLTPYAMPVAPAAPASLDLDIGALDSADHGTPMLGDVEPEAPELHNADPTTAEPEQIQWYHIMVPPPLPHCGKHSNKRT